MSCYGKPKYPRVEESDNLAPPKDKASEIILEVDQRGEPEPTESLILFRCHHALADGISLAAAFMDLCDEAAQLKEDMKHETQQEKKKRRALSWWQRLANCYIYSTIIPLDACEHSGITGECT